MSKIQAEDVLETLTKPCPRSRELVSNWAKLDSHAAWESCELCVRARVLNYHGRLLAEMLLKPQVKPE